MQGILAPEYAWTHTFLCLQEGRHALHPTWWDAEVLGTSSTFSVLLEGPTAPPSAPERWEAGSHSLLPTVLPLLLSEK